jgi:Recombinase
LREVYRLFVHEMYSYREISEILNRNAVPYHDERPWNFYAVKYLLTNSKYNGWLTYGKWTRRLHTKQRKTSETQWLRVPHPTARLIDDATFAAARTRIKNFTINKSNEQLLYELRSILAANGKVSANLIRRIPGAALPALYRYRFGSLVNAFQLIGYEKYVSKLVVTRRRVQEMRMHLILRLQEMFPRELSARSLGGWSRSWLQMSNATKISVRFCIQPVTVRATPAWCFRRIDRESQWTTLMALLNRENTQIERLLLFLSMPNTSLHC